MVRIRGTIGDWPVDLTVELDDSDWAKLGAQLPVADAPVSQPAARPVNQDDAVWEATKDSRLDAAALPALLIVLIGLLPVIVLVRLLRSEGWSSAAEHL